MLERLAEQEKLEQLSAIRRRAKQAEHRQAVEKLLEERQKEREEARRRVQHMQLQEEQEHKQKYSNSIVMLANITIIFLAGWPSLKRNG